MSSIICEECHVDISHKPQTNKRFCSISCANISHKKFMSLEGDKLKSQNITAYMANPTICKNCNQPLSYDKRRNLYCDQSCAATYNNSKRTQATLDKQRKSVTITARSKINPISQSEKDRKRLFYAACTFRFTRNTMAKLPGFDLLLKHGIYHITLNKGGVVRDHLVSKGYAWIKQYDPAIIRHPANCRIMLNPENSSKGIGCLITYEELIERIHYWNKGIILPLSEESMAIPRKEISSTRRSLVNRVANPHSLNLAALTGSDPASCP